MFINHHFKQEKKKKERKRNMEKTAAEARLKNSSKIIKLDKIQIA